MRTVWSGPLLPVALAVLCGQGALMLVWGGGTLGPVPAVMSGLSIVILAVLTAVGRRGAGAGGKPGWFDPRVLLVVCGLALQVGAWGYSLSAGRGALREGAAQTRTSSLAAARERLEGLLQGCDELAREAEAQIAGSGGDAGPALFSLAARIRGRGPDHGLDTAGLEVVLWDGDQRVAWTDGAVPLAAPRKDTAPAELAVGRRVIAAEGGRWYLREWIHGRAGLRGELQIALPGTLAADGDRAVAVTVTGPRMAAKWERTGRPGAVFHPTPGDGEPVLWLEPLAPSGDGARRRSLWLVLFAGGWLLAGLAGLAPRPADTRGLVLLLVAAWGGRAVLARLEAATRLTDLVTGLEFPVSPRSVMSLLDPAYFATPALGGWLASAADALVSSGLVLLAVTLAWLVLGRPRALAAGGVWRPGWGRGPVAAVAFGLSTAVGMGLLGRVAVLVATNANARLVGTDIPLDAVSFWILHLVLTSLAVALVLSLALVLSAGLRPGARRSSGGMAGLLLVPLAAGLGSWLWPLPVASGGLLPAVVACGLWLVLPGLGLDSRLMRRLALPAALLLVVVFTHAVLSDLDGAAERRWLKNRVAAVTSADDGWTRFLLGSILEDMAAGDRPGEQKLTADIWQDEAAWRLWKDSALEDLGGACLVELLDTTGEPVSLVARGFLRDFQYEVLRRSAPTDRDGRPTDASGLNFQTELRVYTGGRELVLIGEIPRREDAGWIRVEMPLRSWRVSTLQARFLPPAPSFSDGYRPRAEVTGPVLLVRGDASGWLQAADDIFPDPGWEQAVRDLKSGRREWARIGAGGQMWLCRWQPLPLEAASSGGEGLLVGLQVPGLSRKLLDLSRLMLLNLVFLFLIRILAQAAVWVAGWEAKDAGARWRIGFQERFLGGYLLLGMFLLLVVGMSVDQAGYRTVRQEARDRTRQGLSLATEQLRSLLVEQARSLAGSEYIADLLVGQLAGNRPVGPVEFRQAMVFDGEGNLLLDETLSDLTTGQARALLDAGRSAPLVVIHEGTELYLGAVIPIDLSGLAEAAPSGQGQGQDAPVLSSDGFFLYRQRLDEDLLVGLADLVRGEATLSVQGRPLLASNPEEFFTGHRGRLAAAGMMGSLLRHPDSPGVFAGSDRPFAFTGAMPLPAFGDGDGSWLRDALPAVLAVSFPDREREFATRRKATILFLTGLANLILLTALALAGILGWSIFRPLQVLADATRSLAAGDDTAPLPEPGPDEVGELTEAFGTMRSQLSAARKKLAARERFLSLVLEHVPVGVGVLDSGGELVVLNPAGRRILEGFAPGMEAAAALRELRGRLERSDTPGGAEVRSADRRRTVRGATAPLDLPGGRTDRMVVFEDITEFLTNKKLALSAELARQVAHEIKNPLTPIQLSAQLLGQAWRDRHDRLDTIVPDAVQRILDQVDLLRRIASEFSLLGRPDQLDITPVDLPALVRETAAAYGAGCEGAEDRAGTDAPRVDIAAGEVPAVLANAESVRKVLGNLMQNSLDAASDDGPARIEVRWSWDDRTVTLTWRDHGAGIPADVADHLFDPYFSTKTRGTGLGLAICRSLVDRMGGVITLENHPDGPGAVAALTLPRADASPAGKDS